MLLTLGLAGLTFTGADAGGFFGLRSGFRSRLSGHAFIDRKYCKYRIADEPQNFTATSDDGAGRDLEIIVQGE